jgi:hypothetical protein
MDVLSKPAAASACEFNWSAVGKVERKGRSMHPASTNRSVNVAANYKLEEAITRRGVCQRLPTLDAVIEELVEDAEDEAPLGHMDGLDEIVLGPSSDGQNEHAEPEVEEEHADVDADRQAQASLYADWAERDALLPGV